MGKVTGFLEIERHDRKYAPVAERAEAFSRVRHSPDGEGNARPGRALHELRHSLLPRHRLGGAGHPGLSGQQPDPRLQRSGLSGQLAGSRAQPAFDQQFSGIHRPHLPGAVRASCTLNIDDNPVTIKTIECAIVDRAWENGWIKPEIAAAKTGKKVAVIGAGPAGLACAQQLARAGHDVHRVREIRQGRRPSALRHSRLQDGEGRHRPPRRRRWRPRASPFTTAPMSAARGSRRSARTARRIRRDRADRRRGSPARPADSRPRSRRHSLCDGFPAAAKPPRRQRAARRRRARFSPAASMWS